MDAARVLIVDDHALVGAGLVRMLEAEGLQPHWCGDTAAALDALRDAAWQVVLLDVSLPGGDGLDRDWPRDCRAGGAAPGVRRQSAAVR